MEEFAGMRIFQFSCVYFIFFQRQFGMALLYILFNVYIANIYSGRIPIYCLEKKKEKRKRKGSIRSVLILTRLQALLVLKYHFYFNTTAQTYSILLM